MSRKKYNEVVAGVFVLAALAAIVGVVLWLGASQFFRTKGQIVSFYVPQSNGPTGLQVGATVNYGDSGIGRIIEVLVVPEKDQCIYHVQLERKDITIYSNGKGLIVSPFVGQPVLALTSSGSPPSPLADDEHPIPLSGGMQEAMTNIARSAENIQAISAAIRKFVDVSQGGLVLKQIDSIVADLKTVSANFVTITTAFRNMSDPKNADSTIARINKTVEDLSEMTSQARPKVDQMLTSAADLTRRLDEYAQKDVADLLARLRESNTQIFKMSQNLAEVSQQAREAVAMNRDSVDTMVDNMTKVSANLKAMSEEVRRAPWLLLYKPTPKEVCAQGIQNAARAFSEGAGQMEQTAAKLAGLIKASPEGIKGDHPALKQTLKELQERFQELSKYEQALWEELKKK
jgi:ABC-type transporter Mla subunit MlaD